MCLWSRSRKTQRPFFRPARDAICHRRPGDKYKLSEQAVRPSWCQQSMLQVAGPGQNSMSPCSADMSASCFIEVGLPLHYRVLIPWQAAEDRDERPKQRFYEKWHGLLDCLGDESCSSLSLFQIALCCRSSVSIFLTSCGVVLPVHILSAKTIGLLHLLKKQPALPG